MDGIRIGIQPRSGIQKGHRATAQQLDSTIHHVMIRVVHTKSHVTGEEMNRFRLVRIALAAGVLLGLTLQSQPSPVVIAAGIPDYRFGVVEAHDAPNAAAALGAGWTRVTFPWNEIQPNSPDEWNATRFTDQALATELAYGRQVVGLLVTTPGWATDVGRGGGVPQGLYLAADDPNNHWANLVRRIIGQYSGRINHWIIWNEPDIPSDSVDNTWGGSVEDYVQLLRVAYTVAKQTNPNAVIHLAAITHHHNEHWFGQFIESLDADPNAATNNFYFDVASLNLFHEPEKVYDITVHYTNMLRGHGINKPFWLTETNAYLSRVSLEQQAMFITQAFSLEIAAGVQRIEVFKMADRDTDQAADPEPFGLVDLSGSRRPAFTAYQVATNYLSGFTGGTWERRDEISVVVIDRGTQTTTVVWARTPEPQKGMIAARATRALLVNVWGAAKTIYPERGYYFIDLPGADCTNGCQMGGAPYMLIENAPASADTASPPASPTPPPPVEGISVEATETNDPLPTNTPTRTPTPTATPTRTPRPTQTPSPSDTPTAAPTDTPSPTSTATPVPSPTATATSTPTPPPPFDAASKTIQERPWPLVGVIALALSGGAIFVNRRRTRRHGAEDTSQTGE